MPTAQLEINGKMASIEYPEGMSQEDVIARVKAYHGDSTTKTDNVMQRLGADFGFDVEEETQSQGQTPTPSAAQVAPTTPPAQTEGVNETPLAERLANYAKGGIDLGPVNIPSPTSMLNPKKGAAALAGAASMVPGGDMLSAFVGHNIENIIRPFQGKEGEGIRGYLDRLSRHKDIRKEIENKDQMAALAGKIVGGTAGGAVGLARAATPLARILASVGTNVGVGQQDVDASDMLSGENAKKVGIDALMGLIPSAAIEGYSAAKKPVAAAVSKMMKSPFVKDKLGRIVKSIPVLGDYIESGQKAKATAARDMFTQKEAMRKSYYDSAVNKKKAALEAKKIAQKQAQEGMVESTKIKVKTLPESDVRGAGESFISATDELDAGLAKKVSDAAKPVLEKYGTAKLPIEKSRNVINEALKGQDLLDATGNVSDDAINLIDAPQRKTFANKLRDLSFSMRKNPTVKSVKSMLEDVAEYANFDGKDRTKYERTFGKLYNSLKESFYDGLQSVAKPEEAKAMIESRVKYSQTRPAIDIAKKLTKGGTPEVAVERARNLLKGSTIDAVLGKTPELKEPIQQVVLADLSRASDNAKTFSKAIDKYGRGTLKKLLGNKYNQIAQVEREFLSASKSMAPDKLAVAKFKPHKFSYEQPRPVADAINKRMSNVKPTDSDKIKRLMSYIIGAQGAI